MSAINLIQSSLTRRRMFRHFRGLKATAKLKRRYRDTLRAAVPDVGFVYLALTPTEAAERVSHRPGHFMPATLIESQFRDLETPTGEPRVLTVNATDPWPSIVDAVLAWWR